MGAVFIDSEPPGQGGGIRTYVDAASSLLARHGAETAVFTHNPSAYSQLANRRIHAIGRESFLQRPWRGLLYRLCYHQTVLLEHSRWLARELDERADREGIIEFCDFLGYAFFTLRHPLLCNRIAVRVHTPAFLIAPEIPRPPLQRLRESLTHRVERWCLRHSPMVTAPSARFIQERLPWLTQALYIPNPAPPALKPTPAPNSSTAATSGSTGCTAIRGRAETIESAGNSDAIAPTYLCFGRMEPRKGVHLLIRAFASFLAAWPEAGTPPRLTLAGPCIDNRYRRLLERELQGLSPAARRAVRWLPALDRAARDAEFRDHHFLVMPSLWENSPYACFEAIEAGLVALGTRTGEIGLLLEETGIRSAQPGQVDSLVDCLLGAPRFRSEYLQTSVKQREWLSQRRREADQSFLAFHQVKASDGQDHECRKLRDRSGASKDAGAREESGQPACNSEAPSCEPCEP